MGSNVEVNDTLQLTNDQGFPAAILNLTGHIQKPVTLSDVADKTFQFANKPGARLFHLDPVRVFLVHNIDGKWLIWGKVLIQSQTVHKELNTAGTWTGEWLTSGTYKIIDLYEPDYQRTFTRRESPPGKSYFG